MSETKKRKQQSVTSELDLITKKQHVEEYKQKHNHEFLSELIPKTNPDGKAGVTWYELMKDEFEKEYFVKWCTFLETEYKTCIVYPPRMQIFRVLELLAPINVKCITICKDPYIHKDEANGVALSVNNPTVRTPSSLLNFRKELKLDIQNIPDEHLGLPEHKKRSDIPEKYWQDNRINNLDFLVKQGWLPINATNTVRAGKTGSHEGEGSSLFHTALVKNLVKLLRNAKTETPLPVFQIHGNDAYKILLECEFNLDDFFVFRSTHPSGLSAYKTAFDKETKKTIPSFIGSKPFSTITAWMVGKKLEPFTWINNELI